MRRHQRAAVPHTASHHRLRQRWEARPRFDADLPTRTHRITSWCPNLSRRRPRRQRRPLSPLTRRIGATWHCVTLPRTFPCLSTMRPLPRTYRRSRRRSRMMWRRMKRVAIMARTTCSTHPAPRQRTLRSTRHPQPQERPLQHLWIQ